MEIKEKEKRKIGIKDAILKRVKSKSRARASIFIALIMFQSFMLLTFGALPSNISQPMCSLANSVGGFATLGMLALFFPLALGGVATVAIYSRKLKEANKTDTDVNITEFITPLIAGLVVGFILAGLIFGGSTLLFACS